MISSYLAVNITVQTVFISIAFIKSCFCGPDITVAEGMFSSFTSLVENGTMHTETVEGTILDTSLEIGKGLANKPEEKSPNMLFAIIVWYREWLETFSALGFFLLVADSLCNFKDLDFGIIRYFIQCLQGTHWSFLIPYISSLVDFLSTFPDAVYAFALQIPPAYFNPEIFAVLGINVWIVIATWRKILVITRLTLIYSIFAPQLWMATLKMQYTWIVKSVLSYFNK